MSCNIYELLDLEGLKKMKIHIKGRINFWKKNEACSEEEKEINIYFYESDLKLLNDALEKNSKRR